MTKGCWYCGARYDLRPYGPKGSPICFPCMKARPEREEAAQQQFGAQLDAAEEASEHGAALIDTRDDAGPRPFAPDRGKLS